MVFFPIIYGRPFCEEFVLFFLDNFMVGIWFSTQEWVSPLLAFLVSVVSLEFDLKRCNCSFDVCIHWWWWWYFSFTMIHWHYCSIPQFVSRFGNVVIKVFATNCKNVYSQLQILSRMFFMDGECRYMFRQLNILLDLPYST